MEMMHLIELLPTLSNDAEPLLICSPALEAATARGRSSSLVRNFPIENGDDSLRSLFSSQAAIETRYFTTRFCHSFFAGTHLAVCSINQAAGS